MTLYATPETSFVMSTVVVTTVFTVKIDEAGIIRTAEPGEIELRLFDVWVGGQLEYNPKSGQPLNNAGNPVTDDNGQVTFPGCAGINEWPYGNPNKYRFDMKHMLTEETQSENLYLGKTEWTYNKKTYPYSETLEVEVMVAPIETSGGLLLKAMAPLGAGLLLWGAGHMKK